MNEEARKKTAALSREVAVKMNQIAELLDPPEPTDEVKAPELTTIPGDRNDDRVALKAAASHLREKWDRLAAHLDGMRRLLEAKPPEPLELGELLRVVEQAAIRLQNAEYEKRTCGTTDPSDSRLSALLHDEADAARGRRTARQAIVAFVEQLTERAADDESKALFYDDVAGENERFRSALKAATEGGERHREKVTVLAGKIERLKADKAALNMKFMAAERELILAKENVTLSAEDYELLRSWMMEHQTCRSSTDNETYAETAIRLMEENPDVRQPTEDVPATEPNPHDFLRNLKGVTMPHPETGEPVDIFDGKSHELFGWERADRDGMKIIKLSQPDVTLTRVQVRVGEASCRVDPPQDAPGPAVTLGGTGHGMEIEATPGPLLHAPEPAEEPAGQSGFALKTESGEVVARNCHSSSAEPERKPGEVWCEKYPDKAIRPEDEACDARRGQVLPRQKNGGLEKKILRCKHCPECKVEPGGKEAEEEPPVLVSIGHMRCGHPVVLDESPGRGTITVAFPMSMHGQNSPERVVWVDVIYRRGGLKAIPPSLAGDCCSCREYEKVEPKPDPPADEPPEELPPLSEGMLTLVDAVVLSKGHALAVAVTLLINAIRDLEANQRTPELDAEITSLREYGERIANRCVKLEEAIECARCDNIRIKSRLRKSEANQLPPPGKRPVRIEGDRLMSPEMTALWVPIEFGSRQSTLDWDDHCNRLAEAIIALEANQIDPTAKCGECGLFQRKTAFPGSTGFECSRCRGRLVVKWSPACQRIQRKPVKPEVKARFFRVADHPGEVWFYLADGVMWHLFDPEIMESSNSLSDVIEFAEKITYDQALAELADWPEGMEKLRELAEQDSDKKDK